MPRRLTLAVPIVLVIAMGFAAFAAFSASRAGATAGGADGGTMHMSMPAADAASANARSAVELHRTVVQVTIKNFAFVPRRLVVSPGTKVVWTNKDSEPHTVTSDHPAFHSEAINTDGHYTLMTRNKGTFTYHCQIHPFMHGTLVVQG
jgi:plastocyanin